jgi:transposase InsO family protein
MYPALGLDSLHHMVRPEFQCSRNRVWRLMKKADIHSARRKAYKRTTNSNHANLVAPNLLKRHFKFSRPNQAWVGDITYIPTGEGWLYLAIVKDLCIKKVVGYAFGDRIDTQLTLAALAMAIRLQKPSPGLVFHSDRGIQYASNAYRRTLELYGVTQSMSRKGDPYDNAVAENFFSCLKCESVYLHHFATRSAAKAAVFHYIEAFYNSVRPHSGIGWITPNAFEASFMDDFNVTMRNIA